MKKIVLYSIVILIISLINNPSIAMSSFTDDSDLTYISIDNTHSHEKLSELLITPNVVAACPYGNGICDAVSTGTGKVYLNGNLVIIGGAWQCSKCYTIYVTQNSPLSGYPIGNWASRGWYSPISYNGCIMEVTSISYTSASSIPGVSFRLLDL